MTKTKEGLFVELAVVATIDRMLVELVNVAPESAMVHGLQEARRTAHPACLEERSAPDLHAEFRAMRARPSAAPDLPPAADLPPPSDTRVGE